MKRAIKKKIVWTPELIEAFEVWRRMLADHILCSYRKEDYAVFTVSDASADGYGWAVCQCPREQPLVSKGATARLGNEELVRS